MTRFKFLFAIMFCAITSNVFAQNVLFPTTPGTVLIHEQKDSRGRTTGFSRQTVQRVESSGNEKTIFYLFEMMDRNRNVTAEASGTMIVRDGRMIYDIEQLIAVFMGEQAARANIEITGSLMEIPATMKPGDRFDDAQVSINIQRGIIRMSVETVMSDGKCLAIEEVTVPAGTFKAYKIIQTTATTVMRRTTRTRGVSWYAPNVGLVKSRNYDDRNRLQNTTELIELR